jgi:hypothetical protein
MWIIRIPTNSVLNRVYISKTKNMEMVRIFDVVCDKVPPKDIHKEKASDIVNVFINL